MQAVDSLGLRFIDEDGETVDVKQINYNYSRLRYKDQKEIKKMKTQTIY